MKKYYTLITGIFMLVLMKSAAQCPAGRFVNEVFPTISVSTVTYSAPYNQQMDIYQPAGDTMARRPLIILAHGGSFISGNGDRTQDSTVIGLDTNFAKRGYVTVSIDYRLTNGVNMFDSALATDEVIKAISDGKAAIRYFVKDAATVNTFKIDTNTLALRYKSNKFN